MEFSSVHLSLAPQRSRAPPAGWSRWAWHCFQTWDHPHLWLSPGPRWSLLGGGADCTVRIRLGCSSSRWGNKVIMPRSRGVCLTDSGESCGNRKVGRMRLREGERRGVGKEEMEVGRCVGLSQLCAGVRDNLFSPIATPHHPPAPRFLSMIQFLSLSFPLLFSLQNISLPSPFYNVFLSVMPLLNLIVSCRIAVCLSRRGKALHYNSFLSFIFQFSNALPPTFPSHFHFLSQIHHDLLWLRYYAAKADYIEIEMVMSAI